MRYKHSCGGTVILTGFSGVVDTRYIRGLGFDRTLTRQCSLVVIKHLKIDFYIFTCRTATALLPSHWKVLTFIISPSLTGGKNISLLVSWVAALLSRSVGNLGGLVPIHRYRDAAGFITFQFANETTIKNDFGGPDENEVLLSGLKAQVWCIWSHLIS